MFLLMIGECVCVCVCLCMCSMCVWIVQNEFLSLSQQVLIKRKAAQL